MKGHESARSVERMGRERENTDHHGVTLTISVGDAPAGESSGFVCSRFGHNQADQGCPWNLAERKGWYRRN